MKIVLASRNPKKIRELETLLAENTSMNVQVLSLDDIGYSDEIDENGASFLENALLKAAVPARLGYIGVADDSGLTVRALGGAPGIYSARYAGEHGRDDDNNRKLLAEMARVPDGERDAAFVSVVACVLPRGMECGIPDGIRVTTKDSLTGFALRGECAGTILHERRGSDGFGYDPLFWIPEKGKSFAEMSAAEKNAISHRGNAMRAFCAAFSHVFCNTKEYMHADK